MRTRNDSSSNLSVIQHALHDVDNEEQWIILKKKFFARFLKKREVHGGATLEECHVLNEWIEGIRLDCSLLSLFLGGLIQCDVRNGQATFTASSRG